MKKLIGIVAGLVIGACAFAIDLGVVGGLSFNSLNGSVTYDNTSHNVSPDKAVVGGSVGAALEIPFGKILAIQPEALFHFNNGGEYTWSGSGFGQSGSHSTKQTFNSIEFPVLLKANLSLGSGTLSAFAGPTFNLFIGNIKTENTTKTSGLINSSTTNSSETSFDDANWNTFVVGLEAGAEYAFKFGGGRLAVGCMVNFDLGDLDKYENSSLKRLAITPQITYYFGF